MKVNLYPKTPFYVSIETYCEPQIKKYNEESMKNKKHILANIVYHDYNGKKDLYYVAVIETETEKLHYTEAEITLTDAPLNTLPIEVLANQHYFTGHRNMPGEKGSIDPEVFSQILGMHIPNWHAICEKQLGPGSWRLDLKLVNGTLHYSSYKDEWHKITDLFSFSNNINCP